MAPRLEIAQPEVALGATPVVNIQTGGTAALAAGMQSLADPLQRREQNRTASDAMKAEAEIRAGWAQHQIDLENNMAADGSGYVDSYKAAWEKYTTSALAGYSPEVQNRVRDRLYVTGQEGAAKALATQAAQSAVYQADSVNDAVRQNGNVLLGDPSQFAEIHASVIEGLNELDLPPDKKIEFENKATEQLARSAVEGAIAADPEAAQKAIDSGEWDAYLDPNVKAVLQKQAKTAAEARIVERKGSDIAKRMEPTAPAGGAKGLIKREEGAYQERPFWDKNHFRGGYSSDTWTPVAGATMPRDARTTDGRAIPAGTVMDGRTSVVVRKGDTISVADAENDLDRRIADANRAAVGMWGGAYAALPQQAKDAILSVLYNYGTGNDGVNASLGNAMATGDLNALASVVEGLSANPARRKREAEMIRTADPDAVMNSELADVEDPDLRDRIRRQATLDYALGADARAQQQAALEFDRQQRVADLDLGLSRGQVTYDDLTEARDAGDISPSEWASRVNQLDQLVAGKTEDARTLNSAVARIAAGDEFTPGDADDRKGVDAVYAASDRSLASGVLLTEQTGVAPSTFVKQLDAGMAQGDAEAFSAAAQLYLHKPNAFYGNKDAEGLQKQVSEFNALLGLGRYTAEEAAARVARVGVSAETRAAEDKIIAAELKDAEVSAATIARNFASGLPIIGRGTPELSSESGAQLEVDYRAAYRQARIDGYPPKEADKIATERLKENWDVSEMAGGRLVKYPAERYATRPQDIPQQVLEGLPEGSSAPTLIPNYLTESDIKAGRPPRYQVFYTDPAGTLQRDPRMFMSDATSISPEARAQFGMSDSDLRRAYVSRGLRPPASREERLAGFQQIKLFEDETGQTYGPDTKAAYDEWLANRGGE